MSEATLEKDPVADAPAAEEMVTLVNQGRGDLVVLPGKNGTILSGSRNTLSVPKSLADKIRRHNKDVKNVKDIFPDSPDLAKLQAENEALKNKASTLEKLLNGADLGKKASIDEVAALKAKVEDLGTRLKEFLEAGSKKDLDALKDKHAEAVAA